MNYISETELISDQSRALKQASLSQIDPNVVTTAEALDNNRFHILSRFKDSVWKLPSSIFTDATQESQTILNFASLPNSFQSITKFLIFIYMLGGADSGVRPRGKSIIGLFQSIKLFLYYLDKHNVSCFADVTPMIAANFVSYTRNQISKFTGKERKAATLAMHFNAIEKFYTLSQSSPDVMPHPWPDSSSNYLSGMYKVNRLKASTSIIPDEILSALFTASVRRLNESDKLLEVLNGLSDIELKTTNKSRAINRYLSSKGYKGTLKDFNRDCFLLRDSCVIVILTTSGIRVHELASLQNGGYYTTLGEHGERYYWMQGRSDKTHEGNTEWLVSAITHHALKIAEKLAKPLQDSLTEEINVIDINSKAKTNLESKNKRHFSQSLFLTKTPKKNNAIHTLSNQALLSNINRFANDNGIDWYFTPHQFRRSFANYAARSAYGDLRYLRDHFKHWSIDMTVLYAMNEEQDKELYDEILVAVKNDKISIVEHWLEEDTPLSGGMASQVRTFRNKEKNVRTYKNKRELAEKISENVYIRATTVAWCTADNSGCSGRGSADRTRCGDCKNSVIDDTKLSIWKRIHAQQLELLDVDDIGESGRSRVKRDIERCKLVCEELTASNHMKQAESELT